MNQPTALIDELTFFEGVDVEYKAARGGLPGDVWETYSAFANSEGGTIWLGVSQKGGRLDIHGVPDPEKLMSDFWNTVNNRGKVSLNLLASADVSIESGPAPDRRVVRIRVPRADRRQRPVFIGSDPFRGTFRRNYEGDYRCSEAEVRRMFADQSEEPADSRILEGFTWVDLHPDSIRQFRNRAASSRLGQAWLTEDDAGLLRKLGGWRRDRSSGREGLTLAGLLMFGRNEAIRDPAAVPGFHVDYRERFSDDPNVRWTDRLTPDGTWEGNLFQFYQQVMLKLSSGPGIKRPFQTDSEGYRVATTPVSDALQEALVNALIHADYAGQGGIVIDRYLDRIVFSNPGTLLVSREQLMQGGVSECRNKSLQTMFQVLGAGDKAGSGIDKIRACWTGEHWPSPVLRETMRPERVMLNLPMISTLPDGVLGTLRDRFGAGLDTLDADEIQALVAAHVEGEVSNWRLQDMLTRHRADITHLLRRLVEQGLLEAEGIGRGTRYFLAAGTSPSRREAPPATEGAPPTSPAAPPSTDEKHMRPRAIASRIRGQRRASVADIEAAILELCLNRFVTIQELGNLLGRSPDKLRERYVSALLRDGRLAQRFPDTPSHPDQAYRTTSADDPTATP